MMRSPVEGPLRDALQDLRGLPPVPDADDMLRRVARARRRRTGRLAAGVAALAVVVVAAGTAIGVRTLGAPAPGPAAPSVSPTSTVPPNLAPGFTLSSYPRAWFTDRDHVFVVLMRCPANVCTLSLAASADGGQTWRVHPVPATLTTTGPPGQLPEVMRVLDSSRVVMMVSPAQFSADAGATWTALPAPTVVVDTIPAAGAARVDVGAGGRLSLVVVRPDGTTATLAKVPPGTYAPRYVDAFVRPAADGSLWLSGSDGRSESRTFVTRDRGRTWNQITEPANSELAIFSTEAGGTVFLIDPKRGGLWRSVDGGKHWTSVSWPPFTTDGSAAPFVDAGDGSLLVGDEGGAKTYLLAPGSDEFQAMVWDEHVRADRIGTGYVQRSGTEVPGVHNGGSGSPFLISADRVHWTVLPFQPYA